MSFLSIRSLLDRFMNLLPSLAPVLRAGDAGMLAARTAHLAPASLHSVFCHIYPLLINAADIVLNSSSAFRLAFGAFGY